MDLKLVSLLSSEVDLKRWEPDTLEDTYISLTLEIGTSQYNEEGTNLFYVTLATPEALRTHRKGLILSENRTIIVDRYDYDTTRNQLKEIIKKCQRDTWIECCQVLQRYFMWEYEDYVNVDR